MNKNKKFEVAVEDVLLHEGGYINHPTDPGGETKYGISKRNYPNLDIKSLTREQAKAIYYKNYWWANNLDNITDQVIATKIMNLFVNIGTKSTRQIVSQALLSCGIECNGLNWQKLLTMINTLISQDKNEELMFALREESAKYYKILVSKKPSLKIFLNGWLKRAYS